MYPIMLPIAFSYIIRLSIVSYHLNTNIFYTFRLLTALHR